MRLKSMYWGLILNIILVVLLFLFAYVHGEGRRFIDRPWYLILDREGTKIWCVEEMPAIGDDGEDVMESFCWMQRIVKKI